MTSMTRRLVLTSLAVVGVGAGVLALPATKRRICGSAEEDYAQFAEARVGEACVNCNAALTAAYVGERWAQLASTDLEGAIRDDFAKGRTSVVDGWVLADSETVKYAAVFHGFA